MDRDVAKWLIDIRNSILEIEGFFTGKQMIFAEYQQNTLLRRGCERNLEIIGEAINRVLKHQADIEISNAKKIVQFRNIVIHSYDNLIDETVWAIIIRHLPVLKTEVEKILTDKFPSIPLFIENK